MAKAKRIWSFACVLLGGVLNLILIAQATQYLNAPLSAIHPKAMYANDVRQPGISYKIARITSVTIAKTQDILLRNVPDESIITSVRERRAERREVRVEERE
jgi:hypothetical protein